MNGRTVRGRLGNLTGMGAGVGAGQRAVPARRTGTGAQRTAPGMLPPKKTLTGARKTEAARRAAAVAAGRAVTGVQMSEVERRRINESLPRPTDQVRGDGGATRTPPATKQPVYNAQGRPIGAIRFDPRTGESVFIPPRNAR
jgi:hypothetical protein